ncbi:MAG: Asp-tRNA(Asn)/Glu-tRNA(Gln) amidotransferase subunit GatC [bacterium]|nr:Asp-tRNA(Asn)/Glu-tRNA(Gln) amidotransferase subunit GatC [bacterium]
MTDKVDVRALARLARLEVSDEELAKLEREIPDILKFVETIQAVSAQGYDEPRTVSGGAVTPSPSFQADRVSIGTCRRNVLREDENPHEGGIYTEALMKAAPARVGNRIAVKQVLKRGTSH